MPAKVGRIAQTHVVSRPYAAAKDIQGRKVTCESCDRTMTSKDWPSHERSKKHVELKEKAIRAEQEAKITEQRIDDWVGDQDDSGASENRADQATDNGGWDADATATGDNTNGKWAGGTANAGGWGGGNGGAHGGNGWGDSGNNGGDGYTTQPRRGGRFGGGNGGGSGGRDGGGDNNCFKCGQRKLTLETTASSTLTYPQLATFPASALRPRLASTVAPKATVPASVPAPRSLVEAVHATSAMKRATSHASAPTTTAAAAAEVVIAHATTVV